MYVFSDPCLLLHGPSVQIIVKPDNRYYQYIHHCGEILGDKYTFTSEFPKIEKQKIRVQQEFKKKPVTKCKK